MDNTQLLKKTKVKGIFIFCMKCKKRITNNCGNSGKRISSCKDIDKHKYKLRVCIPGNESAVKTKVFETRDPNQVVLDAYAYRAELESCNYMPKIIESKTMVPKTLLEAMAFYIAYLNNDTPHQQEHKQRTTDHIKMVERYFIFFGDYLKTNNIDASILPFEQLDRTVVGKMKSFLLETKEYAPRTYNKYVQTMRIFTNRVIEEYDLMMKNPFNGFKPLQVAKNISTISKEEFDDLLKLITPENGIYSYVERKTQKKYTKQLFKPWLKDAFLLALLTGRRREALVQMKFNGIIENSEGEPLTIKVEDFKVNKSKNLTKKEEVKYIYIPVIAPLKKLLIELGYEENKGKDMYILAPYEKMQRDSMKDLISKAFTHYFNQLGTGKKVELYDLRKTYISHLYATYGEKARIITKHSGIDVMFNHYIDQEVIAQVASDFEFFDL
jgi:integrase